MKVLLLSHNTTVQGMIALAIDSVDNATLHAFDTIEGVGDGHYDWVFVDDTLPMYQESLALAKRLQSSHVVLLCHHENTLTEGFNLLVLKPFLPDEIRELIEKNTDNKAKSKKEDKLQKKEKRKKKKENIGSQVLNLDEIETIKALLEEDGLEIVHEEELVETVLSEGTSERKKKNTNKELLKALKKMKPKKIRKLLKGAKVKIKISFPKDA